MELSKWGALAGAGLLLVSYNLAQPGIDELRNNRPADKVSTAKTELTARRCSGSTVWRRLGFDRNFG